LNRFGCFAFAAAVALLALTMQSAQATPSMARLTGYACARCHTAFPELTPFGRQFKLGGFAMSSQKWDAAPFLQRQPVSALLQVSRTETNKIDMDGAMSDRFPRDRETIVQAAGVYYGGKITDNSGALIQYNYNGIKRKWSMEMFDVRYANGVTLAGKELSYGVTLNNSPMLSDLYNSTPMWGFPHTDSPVVMPAASTLTDMVLGSQVGGIGAYGMWDDRFYGEFATYRTAKTGIFRFMASRCVGQRMRKFSFSCRWSEHVVHGVAIESDGTGSNGYFALVSSDDGVRPMTMHGFISFRLDVKGWLIRFVRIVIVVATSESWPPFWPTMRPSVSRILK
jgi:hypothetical protein